MKTRNIRLLASALSLVMALSLFCAPVYAADGGGESAQGPTETLTGDGGQAVHYRVDDDGSVSILDEVSDDSMVLAAYWNGSKFLGAQELKVNDVPAQTISNWTRVKLFWLDRKVKPLSPAPVVKTGIAHARTITSGITNLEQLNKRGSRNYVADYFFNDCVYYKNGNKLDDVTKDNIGTSAALLSTMKEKGTVVEFYTDDNEEIAAVKIYEYTVAQLTGDAAAKSLSDGTLQVLVPGVTDDYVDADKVTGWQGLVKDDVVLYYTTALDDGSCSYTIEKAEKVSGKVSSYSSSGELTINGVKYKASEQRGVSGGDVTITEDVFKSWSFSYSLTDEFDFYLDKGGYLCYGLYAGGAKVGLVVETEVTDTALTSPGGLYAKLLFADGSTEIVNVSRVDGKIVTTNVNTDSKITPNDAQTLLTGRRDADALKKFFTCTPTASGYALTELNGENYPDAWGAAEVLGDGTAPVASVRQDAAFAKAVGGEADLDGWSITADAETIFLIGARSGYDGTVTYSVYQGYQSVPELDVTRVTALAKKGSTVAKYVYLETDVVGEAPSDEPVGESKVGLVLEAEVTDAGLGVPGALRAILLFEDGTTEIATVHKVEGLTVKNTVTSADTQISTTDAYKSLVGPKGANIMTKFFRCIPTASGYALTELNSENYPDAWGAAEVLGDGTAPAATIRQDAAFAKAVGGEADLAGWSITADADTIFLIGNRDVNTDAISFFVYRGFQNVPQMDATMITALCANTTGDTSEVNTVAQYVYLETTVEGEAPSDEPVGESKVGLVVETEVTDNTLTSPGGLYAKLLFADGSTEIVNVSRVNGKTVTTNVNGDIDSKISPDDAQTLLSGRRDADALKKFFTCTPTASGYALTELNSENYPDAWGAAEVLGDGTAPAATIRQDAAFAKAVGGEADLAGWSITADAETIFLIGARSGYDGTVTYSVHQGYQSVPELDATRVTALAKKGSTVAKYVYLETDAFKCDPPEGYVFITSCEWSIHADLEGAYLVHIIDADGNPATMWVDEDVKKTIAADSDKIASWDNNEYVGRFCRITQIDELGVVSGLDNGPADIPLYYIVDTGGGVISLSTQPQGAGANVTYGYDSATQFVYVDVGWEDDYSFDSNTVNVRDVATDKMVVSGFGTFNPENFYNEDEVSHVATSTPDSANTDGRTYMSVYAYPIVSESGAAADYVYVVRVLW